MTQAEALEAIKARINGEFDNPALMKLGPLTADKDLDILEIIENTRGTLYLTDSELLELLDGNGAVIEDEDAAKAILGSAGLTDVDLIITRTP